MKKTLSGTEVTNILGLHLAKELNLQGRFHSQVDILMSDSGDPSTFKAVVTLLPEEHTPVTPTEEE